MIWWKIQVLGTSSLLSFSKMAHVNLTSSFSDFSLPQLKKLLSIIFVLHRNAEDGQEQLGTCQQPWCTCMPLFSGRKSPVTETWSEGLARNVLALLFGWPYVWLATTTSSSIDNIIMSTLSCHIYEGHTDQNAPLSGKYRVDYLHISPNRQYILSSIFESHGSPKTNFTALKEKAPKNI